MQNLSLSDTPATRPMFGRRWLPKGAAWQGLSLLVALLVLVPLVVICSAWLDLDIAIWQHLVDTVLASLIGNTLLLCAGVLVGVGVLGVSCAWLISAYEFPGRRSFEWLLILPLAIPSYVLAFVVLGLFDFTGPVQQLLNSVGYTVFIDVRSPLTVILVMSLVLYPYVYLLARVAFLKQSQSTMEVARCMGMSSRQTFFKISLPMARPAIVAGMSLALMETLADFGAVSVFNFDTFTTAIYKTWYGMFNMAAAAQLASMLLLLIALIVLVEKRSRKQSSFIQAGAGKVHQRRALHGFNKHAVIAYLSLILLLAFILPVIQLLIWAWPELWSMDQRFVRLITNTLLLGAMAAVVTVLGALIVQIVQRKFPSRLSAGAAFVSNLGYALPGSVLAVGIMLTATGFETWLGASGAGLLTGSAVVLILAYFVRFIAVASGPIHARLMQIHPHLIEAAYSLGFSTRKTLSRLMLPLLQPGLLTALLLVLVDVMKEMPATLLLRPFGWDTLAVRVYEMTSEGEWERAALPALILVLIGLLPVILVMKKSEQR